MSWSRDDMVECAPGVTPVHVRKRTTANFEG